MKFRPPIFILILILTLISTLYMNLVVVRPYVELRIEHEDSILAGQMDAPYQYRVLQPAISRVVQSLLASSFPTRTMQHIIAYTFLDYATFAGIFFAFLVLLKSVSLPDTSALLGLTLLQVVIPLSITGYDVNGDFITLLFYLIGLNLVFNDREAFLPLVIGIATFNREQIIFLIVFYIAYRLGHPKGLDKRALRVIVLSLVAFIAAYLSMRYYYGFKVSPATPQLHIANNTDPQRLLYIVLLWSAQVAGYVALCVMAFKRSIRYFKLAFLSLGAYGALFFVNGNLWEMAKFLPAFIIMIPMGLQVITEQYVEASSLYGWKGDGSG
jgi:hypothetical protein